MPELRYPTKQENPFFSTIGCVFLRPDPVRSLSLNEEMAMKTTTGHARGNAL